VTDLIKVGSHSQDEITERIAQFHRDFPPPGAIAPPPYMNDRKFDHLGDAPIEDQYAGKMNALGQAIDELFNGADAMPGTRGEKDQRKVGFVLLVFECGDKPASRCNFISNGADRRDVVNLMKEMIQRFTGQPEMEGHA
jgi:hypothetical protein